MYFNIMKIRDIEDFRIISHLPLSSTLNAMHSKLPLMCGRKPTTVGSGHVPSPAFASWVACAESPRMTRPHQNARARARACVCVCVCVPNFANKYIYMYIYVDTCIISYYYNNAIVFVCMLTKIAKSAEQIITKF